MSQHVVIISNDVVPGMGVPVAAPGLRVFGVAEGLRQHGLDVTVVVVAGVAERVWRGTVPPTARAGVRIMRAGGLASFLRAQAPVTAILINSNQMKHLGPIDGVRYILDFFAPKMLELAYQHGETYPREALAALRERKIRGIELADAFIVNGAKKVPYFLAWLFQVDRDIRRLPLRVVNMAIPLALRDREPTDEIHLAMTGYLQEWSRPGSWLTTLVRHLDEPALRLELVMPQHWSGREVDPGPHLARLRDHPSTTLHGALVFSEFQTFLQGVDVAIDLFDWTLEREYAMVTRSVVALSCGVPVIHPPFTEVSPLIEAHDAGWLVDPGDEEALDGVFREIVADRGALEAKSRNAAEMAREVIDPRVAVVPLIDVLEELGDRA